jgi:hypothetical protein
MWRLLMRRRSSDRISLALCYLTIAQAIIGIIVISTVVRAQGNDDAQVQLLQYRQASVEGRVTTIEQMNIPARLAVLEASATEMSQVKLLIYGMFITLIGSVVAQVVQIRGQRRLRRYGDDEEPA